MLTTCECEGICLVTDWTENHPKNRIKQERIAYPAAVSSTVHLRYTLMFGPLFWGESVIGQL